MFPHTQLMILAGCGGVGKTTVSASIALTLAQQNYKVALITIDPAKRLAQSLNIQHWQSGLQAVSMHNNLWAMMLDRKHSSHRLVQHFARSPEQAQQILENHYFKAFSRSLAGVQEYMAIYEVNEAIKSQQFDYVILDTPPSTHALDFLDAPKKLMNALNNNTLQFILQSMQASPKTNKSIKQRFTHMGKSLFVKALSTMTADSFIEDLVQFLTLFSEILKGLGQSAHSLEALMQSKATHYHIVCTSEQSVLQSSSQLIQQLRKRSCSIQHIFINRDQQHLYAQLDPTASSDPLIIKGLSAHLQQSIQAVHQWINDDYEQYQQARYELEKYQTPVSTLPSQSLDCTPYDCILNLTPHCWTALSPYLKT